MNYLLDTHAFLWATSKSKELSGKASEIVRNPKNEIYVSAVTFWEIAIKTRIRKLDLDGLTPEELIPLAEEMEFQLIGLSPEESATYGNLKEPDHRDPFDRMLIWQAISRNMTMISRDSEFKKFVTYGLKLVW